MRLSSMQFVVLCIALFSITTLPTQLTGQSKSTEATKSDPKTNELLETVLKKHKLPGGIVSACIKDGKIVTIGAVGVRKIGTDAKITINDKMHLGSCTKAMTSTVAAILVKEKKIRWDSTIEEVLPELKGKVHDDFMPVTLRQLLDHRSGVVRDQIGLSAFHSREIRKQRIDAAIRSMQEKPKHAPGTKTAYSNLGYFVAGSMLEKVADKSWEEIITAKLFKPLDMQSAGFGAPGKIGKIQQPWGHFFGDDKKYRPNQVDNLPALGPAGRVHCTISDWAKFIMVHADDAASIEKVLDAKSVNGLHVPVKKAGYCFGWTVTKRDWTSGIVLNHSGSNRSWYSVVWVAPKDKFAVLSVANCGGADVPNALDEISYQMIKRFLK